MRSRRLFLVSSAGLISKQIATSLYQSVSSPILEYLGALKEVAVIDPFGVMGDGSGASPVHTVSE